MRSLTAACLVIVALGAVLLMVAARSRRSLVEWSIRRGLDQSGFELEALVVESVSIERTVLRDIRLSGDVELRIGRVEAAYSWDSLREEDLTALEIQDVQLRLPIGEGGEAIEETQASGADVGAEPPINDGAAATSLPLESLDTLLASPFLPARKIDLSGLQIELIENGDPFELRGGIQAEQSGERLDATVRLSLLGPVALAPGVVSGANADLELRIGAEPGRLRATLSPVDLRIEIQDRGEPASIESVTPEIEMLITAVGPGVPPRVEVVGSGGRISAPEKGLEARQVGLRMDFAADELPRSIDLEIAEILDLRRPPRIPTLSLALNLQLVEQRLPFRLSP